MRTKYSEGDVVNGIDYITSGASVREASRRSKLPNSMLRWRLRNTSRKTRTYPLMNPNDEKQIADYAQFQANKGTPVTLTWLKETGARLINHRLVRMCFIAF